jgi:hypothetical protein
MRIDQVLGLFSGDTAADWAQHPNGGGWVRKSATVAFTAFVGLDAMVFGSAQVSDYARIYGEARVLGRSQVSNNAQVSDHARVSGDARVFDRAGVYGEAWVSERAWVFGTARVFDRAWVSGNARVSAPEHLVYVGPLGPHSHMLTAFRTQYGGVRCNIGDCSLMLAAFHRRVLKTYPAGHVHREPYLHAIHFIEGVFDTHRQRRLRRGPHAH